MRLLCHVHCANLPKNNQHVPISLVHATLASLYIAFEIDLEANVITIHRKKKRMS